MFLNVNKNDLKLLAHLIPVKSIIRRKYRIKFARKPLKVKV